MALPGSCEDPVALCCDNLYDLTKLFVDAAADAVEDCLGELCRDFGRFVSHDAPIGPGDYVAGWWSDMRPAQQSPGKQLFVPALVATLNVRLVETGFPTMDTAGDRILLPSFAKYDYAASHSYSHAEVATRAILNNLGVQGICQSIRFMNMRPQRPESDLVAWDWTLAAQMRF